MNYSATKYGKIIDDFAQNFIPDEVLFNQ